MALLSGNVLRLLKSYGTTVSLTKPLYGSYDPATGTFSSTSTITYLVKCYFADFTLSESGNDSITEGDRKAYLPTTDTSGNALPKPDTEDFITGVGDKAMIVRVQELYSGDNLICYICHVRS